MIGEFGAGAATAKIFQAVIENLLVVMKARVEVRPTNQTSSKATSSIEAGPKA